MKEIYIVPVITGLILAVFDVYCNIWSWGFYIGLIRVILTIWSSVKTLRRSLFQKPLDLPTRYGEGSYVLITGGANGIGLEQARQFAEFGFNLILLDKDEAGLKLAKEEITEKFQNVDVKIVVGNLAQLHNVEDYYKAIEGVDGLDISILINNAGFIDGDDFYLAKAVGIREIIQVNSVAPVIFTSIFYSKLSQRKKRSAIINIASTLGGAPVSTIPMYAPTKALVRYFSLGLANENPKNIDILTVTPGSVTSNFNFHRKAIDTGSPTITVSKILSSLGQDSEIAGWWMHEIIKEVQMAIWYINHEFYVQICNLLEVVLNYKHLKQQLQKK